MVTALAARQSTLDIPWALRQRERTVGARNGGRDDIVPLLRKAAGSVEVSWGWISYHGGHVISTGLGVVATPDCQADEIGGF
jgi:hypothetical protein